MKFKCVKTVSLFPPQKKNRRRNAKEWEEELLMSRIWKRPPVPMIYDPPFYPWVPPTPLVNFDLGYK